MSWLITGTEKTPVDQFGIQSVSLLLHGDGANGSTTITDSSLTPKTVTAVGNAQISTAQSKFGGASIAFDGNGDYATAPISSAFEFGTGDFTVEAWVRINTFATINKDVSIVSIGRGANGGSGAGLVTTGWKLRITDTAIKWYRYDGATETDLSRSFSFSTNIWYHVAASRSGTSLRIFVDGVQQGDEFNSTISYNQVGTGGSQDLHIGRFFTGDPTGQAVPGVSYYAMFLNGYIDDLRITKGVARYTANFTPPTAPFPDI